jgi:hypothetical protein
MPAASWLLMAALGPATIPATRHAPEMDAGGDSRLDRGGVGPPAMVPLYGRPTSASIRSSARSREMVARRSSLDLLY